MNGLKRIKIIFSLLLVILTSQVFAQYEIKKYTINSGGGKMTGGIYEINASIGQVDASGTQTGGTYSLNGGFWQKQEIMPQSELIFTNGFE